MIDDSSVFESLKQKPSEIVEEIRNNIPESIRRDCKWAITEAKLEHKSFLPKGYIIPKRKKDFRTGRPIVPCTTHFMIEVHIAAGRIINDVTAIAYKDRSLNMPTTDCAIKLLKRFREMLNDDSSINDAQIIAFNRDLSGFFTSIPQADIIKALKQMFMHMHERAGSRWQDEHFWTTRLAGKRQPVCRGRAYFTGAVRMSERTVAEIVEHSFTIAVFTIGKTVMRQRRGSLIGFPLSAALCIMTVMVVEASVLHIERPISPTRRWIGSRYVDNLLTVHIRRGSQDGLPPVLYDLQMYGSTVILEFEPDLSYLGLELVIRHGSIKLALKVPGYCEILEHGPCKEPTDLIREKWRYRSPTAGCSPRNLLAGFASRPHMAARYAFPKRRSQAGVVQLFCVALVVGHTRVELRKLMNKHAKAYPMLYEPWLLRELRQAMITEHEDAVHLLRRCVANL